MFTRTTVRQPKKVDRLTRTNVCITRNREIVGNITRILEFVGKLEQNITSFSKIVGKFQNFSTISKSYGIIKAERGNNMFKKERINNFKTLVDSYKEIDKKIVDIKVAMHDLEKLSYSEDIDFLENLEKQLENMNIEFYKLKQEIIKKVEKF